jgi:hypothetical protein
LIKIHFELFRSQGVQCVTIFHLRQLKSSQSNQFNFVYAKSLNEKAQGETSGRNPGRNSRRGIA